MVLAERDKVFTSAQYTATRGHAFKYTKNKSAAGIA